MSSDDETIIEGGPCDCCGKPLQHDPAHPYGWPYEGYCNAICGLRANVLILKRDADEQCPSFAGALAERAMNEILEVPQSRPLARIEVLRKGEGFLARVAGDKTKWDYGTSAAEAIGKLVLVWPEAVGVDPGVREIH